MPASKGFRGKQERSRDLHPIGDILAGLLGRREFAGGARVGRLAAAWDRVVGERLAAESSPTRLENGILTVRASTGAWGTQLDFLAGEIRQRANEQLGSPAVKRVRVTVGPEAAKPLQRKGPKPFEGP